MNAMSTLKLPMRLLARRSEFAWRYLANGRPAWRYAAAGERPTGIAAAVAADLKRDGVAIIRARELVDPKYLDDLESAICRLETAMAGEVAKARAEVDEPGQKVQKPFVVPLLDADQGLDPRRIYSRFALQTPIRQVVNRYFGMYAALTHTNVWHTVVTTKPASQSQLWHRDPEDRHILKLFLYMTDVDEGSGPFTYAKGSHRRPYQIAPYSQMDGQTPRSTDAELARLVPPDQWLPVTVPKGTLVFADTRGYHKGGLARRSERIAYVAEYLPRSATGISTA